MNELQDQKATMALWATRMLARTAGDMLEADYPCKDELYSLVGRVFSLMVSEKAFYTALSNHYSEHSPAESGELSSFCDELQREMDRLIDISIPYGLNLGKTA